MEPEEKKLCAICKKKEAVVHYAEILDGVIKKLDLCETCAIEKGIETPTPFSMGDLVGAITERSEETCEQCGMTFDDFRKVGRLGCDLCYETFQESLLSIIEQIHRSTQHKGKIPSRFHEEKKKFTAKKVKCPPEYPVQQTPAAPFSQEDSDAMKLKKIQSLEQDLKSAISAEEFEKAACLRDELKKLKGTL
ncbi:MAG: UvrB/UvrC motif-containing protein [Candidatus Aureabacteria bacterium]|nr:UvrB/UvrC motif-containing protein [Candidatus Auribacterota bacterium]